MLEADGVYDRTKPWRSNEERIAGDRLLEAYYAPQQPSPTPLWQRQGLFPDRFGYERRALDVADCFAIETQYGNARDDYSRVTSGAQSSSTPSLPVF